MYKRISIMIILIVSFFSCVSLKNSLQHHFTTGGLDLKVTITNQETVVFDIKNTNNYEVSFPYDMYLNNNMLYVYSPRGNEFEVSNHSSGNIRIKPNTSYSIEIKHFDLFLLHDLKAKDTGNYRCVWKNETHNFEIEFEYYFDYEKTKIKYKLEDL